MQEPPKNPTSPQYQSFPDASGDSDSLEKLKALRLPALAHKSFLDVGCNEGFFCGYALFDGASRVMGIDTSPLYLERARQRFPAAEFLCQSWDVLPATSFDVILLASSLHYATDQAALIHRLMQLLSPDGTLVLELGIGEGSDQRWVQVDRGMDIRCYPTRAQLDMILQPYAGKWISKSVSQRGDPVPRYVVHVARRKPAVYLLMQDSGFGKTSVAQSLMVPAGVPVISGDQCLVDIAQGQLPATAALKDIISKDLDNTRLDEAYDRVLRAGMLSELIQAWRNKAGSSSFAVDAYIPQEHRRQVSDSFISAGYLVVTLTIAGVTELEPLPYRKSSAELYARALCNIEVPHTGNSTGNQGITLPFTGTFGVVNEVKISGRLLRAWGWAVHMNGLAPEWLDLQIDGVSTPQQKLLRFARPDVQNYLKLPTDIFGFSITIPVPAGLRREKLEQRIQVFAGESKTGAVTALWSVGTMPDKLPF